MQRELHCSEGYTEGSVQYGPQRAHVYAQHDSEGFYGESLCAPQIHLLLGMI